MALLNVLADLVKQICQSQRQEESRLAFSRARSIDEQTFQEAKDYCN